MTFANPEFRRNLWLELTPARLGVSVLAVVSLLALAGVRGDADASVAYAAELLFGAVVFLWGGRLAADSVVEEIAERTWDNQRMSALGPWAMSWGKLFGAPICAWAAAIPAVAAMAIASPDIGDGLRRAATYVLLGVLCHAVALTLSLQSIRKGRQPGRMKTLFFHLVALAVVLPFAYFLVWSDELPAKFQLRWFFVEFSSEEFALVSALLFSAWAVLGVYRQMRLELQKPTAPTAWLCFAAFLIAYQTGLIAGAGFGLDLALRDVLDATLVGTHWISVALLAAGALLSGLVYLAIFTEPKSMIGLRQCWDAFRRGEARALWLHLPRWAVTLKLTALAIILIVVFVRLPDTAREYNGEVQRYAIASFLFLLRNVGIVLLCNFIAGSARGDMAAFIVLAVLSLVAPTMFAGAHDVVQALFMPPVAADWATSLVPIAAQLVLVGGLLARVWMQAEKQRNKPV